MPAHPLERRVYQDQMDFLGSGDSKGSKESKVHLDIEGPVVFLEKKVQSVLNNKLLLQSAL